MGLPYTYRTFFETDITDKKFFIKLRKIKEPEQFDNIFYENGVYKLDFKPQLFGTKNSLKLEFKNYSTGFYYEFSLEGLIKISILIISISAFIIKDLVNLFIFNSIFILISYVLVIFHTKNYLENIFNLITKEDLIAEEMSPQQISWLNESNKCPACGADLSEYDSFCQECELNLKSWRKTKKQPVSRTGFENYKIKYNYYQEKSN